MAQEEEILVGQLLCENCTENENCDKLHDRCIANAILNDIVVHYKKFDLNYDTSSFIEKACEFFGEYLWKYINVKNANCATFINIDGDKLKEDFEKYMKGE